jgi:hypothetical protein
MTKKGHLLLGLLVGLVLSILACGGIARQVNWRKTWDWFDGGAYAINETASVYEFDPDTITVVVSTGEFLTPVPPGSPLPASDMQTFPVSLSDDTLYEMANSLLANENGDPKLVLVSFSLACTQIDVGPRSTTFAFIRFVDEALDFPYHQEDVLIWIDRGKVQYTSRWENYLAPHAEAPAIDYLNLPIRIHEALSIAEDNGGREFRNSIENACSINGGSGGGWGTGQWRVGYVVVDDEGNRERMLDFEINAIAGEIEVVSE